MARKFTLRTKDEIQARVIYAACNDRMKWLTIKFNGKKKHSIVNQTWFKNFQDETELLIKTMEQLETSFNLGLYQKQIKTTDNGNNNRQ